MVQTTSTMLPLGTAAPSFALPDVRTEKTVALDDFTDSPALLVMFLCNHCPYVKHIRSRLADVAREYLARGVAIVGISSNDAEKYPDDGPDPMIDEARSAGYDFPYLYDETQEVAIAYRAACTPDFFVFDQDCRLVYRGQFDDSRPGNGLPVTGKDLMTALNAVLAAEQLPIDQKPSIGCNIKWKPGNEPDYFK